MQEDNQRKKNHNQTLSYTDELEILAFMREELGLGEEFTLQDARDRMEEKGE